MCEIQEYTQTKNTSRELGDLQQNTRFLPELLGDQNMVWIAYYIVVLGTGRIQGQACCHIFH
jgi:hypothetical protein